MTTAFLPLRGNIFITRQLIWRLYLNNHMHQNRVGDDLLERSSAEKDLGVGHEPAVCPGGQKKKASGILECIKECGHQVEQGDPPPLFRPGEAMFRLLYPVLGSPVEKRQGSPRSPAQGHKDDEGPGASSV